MPKPDKVLATKKPKTGLVSPDWMTKDALAAFTAHLAVADSMTKALTDVGKGLDQLGAAFGDMVPTVKKAAVALDTLYGVHVIHPANLNDGLATLHAGPKCFTCPVCLGTAISFDAVKNLYTCITTMGCHSHWSATLVESDAFSRVLAVADLVRRRGQTSSLGSLRRCCNSCYRFDKWRVKVDKLKLACKGCGVVNDGIDLAGIVVITLRDLWTVLDDPELRGPFLIAPTVEDKGPKPAVIGKKVKVTLPGTFKVPISAGPVYGNYAAPAWLNDANEQDDQIDLPPVDPQPIAALMPVVLPTKKRRISLED